MEPTTPCGETTATGATCRRRVRNPPCLLHRGSETGASAPFDGKDLHQLARWVARGLASGEIQARDAQAFVAVARLLKSLGPDPEVEARMWKRFALQGMIMHGMPPRDEAEWELAAEYYDDTALEEFRRWERIGLKPW